MDRVREAKDAKPTRDPRGIVISDGRHAPVGPRIVAFIWGGKVPQPTTLQFGRWKSATN